MFNLCLNCLNYLLILTDLIGERFLFWYLLVIIIMSQIFHDINLAETCYGMMSDSEDIINLDSIEDDLAKRRSMRLRALKLDNICL